MRLSRGTGLNIAIAVVACVSVGAVWATRDAPNPSEGRERSLLPDFDKGETTRVEFRSAGQSWVIERNAGDHGSASFRLVEPVEEPADPVTADRFLSSLGNARALRPVASGPALSQFGLDKPIWQAIVHGTKRSFRVAVGGIAPTPEGARYVAVSEGAAPPRLSALAKSVLDDLLLELDAFRQRSLISVSESDVFRIGITGPKLDLRLHRSSGIDFMIEGKPPRLADRDALKSLFFQLSRLSASHFLSAAQANAALGADAAHFEIESRERKQDVAFEAGGSCPGDASQLVVVRRAPESRYACAAREIEATLRLAPGDFSSHHAFSLHTDEVEELAISGGTNKFSLLRKGSGFVLHTNTETELALEAGNQRIAALLEAQGELVEHPQLEQLGLESPSSTITLRSSAAREADVLQQVVRVGKTDAERQLYVYREQDGAVLRVPHDQARAFGIDSTLLYPSKLTEFGLSSFVSAEIERPQQRELLRRGTDLALRLDDPKGFEPDGVLSSDLIQTLGALSAERFVADRDDGAFGFSQSRLGVRFVFKLGTEKRVEHHLRFGAETALGVFATLDDDGPVFVLPRAVRETCDTLLINRAVFPSSADALSAITFESGARSLRLERQGERFVPVPPNAFPEAHVPELLEAFSDARPEAGVHTGPALPSEGFSRPSLTLRLSSKLGPEQTISFGAGDSWRQTRVSYLRVSGVDATFVIARSKVAALTDAL